MRKRVERLGQELSLVATSAAFSAVDVPEAVEEEPVSIFTADGAIDLDRIDGGVGADDDD